MLPTVMNIDYYSSEVLHYINVLLLCKLMILIDKIPESIQNFQMNTVKNNTESLNLNISVKISIFLPMIFCLSFCGAMNMETVHAITQFYFAIPDVITDLDGITFSVETFDDINYDSWVWSHNGSYFIPLNYTLSAPPLINDLHLDNNDFLLAVPEDTEIGTRISGCISIPTQNEQFDCQWDAIDKNHTAYFEFDFYFQSHEDSK